MYKRIITIISIIIVISSSIAFTQSQTSQHYSLSQPKIVISVGESVSGNYTLGNVIIGGVFGGRAESANYSLKTYFLPGSSIYICPLYWTLDAINPGESRITEATDRIIVKNAGSVKTSYSLSVVDVSGTWDPSDTLDGNDLNKFIISGIFTDKDTTDINEANFNEVDTDDIILSYSQSATNAKYATTTLGQNGARVSPGGERALWLKFTAPKIDVTEDNRHDLWLILEAKEVK